MLTCDNRELPLACAILLLVTLVVASAGCDEWSPFGPPTTVYPDYHETPSWSVQGLIAYRNTGASGLGDAGIWVIDPDSGESWRITEFGLSPAWSPDGSGLAISYNARIHTMSADGTDLAELTGGPWDHFPDWSPTGDEIAWSRNVGEPRGILTVSADGGAETLYYPYGVSPDWNPLPGYERLILCQSGIDHMPAIVEVDLDNPEFLRVVLREDEYAWLGHPVYSPDASRIAFERDVPEHVGPPNVWVMDLDGTSLEQLTSEGGLWPSWSPDGTEIVYMKFDAFSNADDVGVLWIVDVMTREERQLTHKASLAELRPSN